MIDTTKMTYDRHTDTYWGRCPFCGRTTDSFSVSEKTGVFYCYVCGRKGNIKKKEERPDPVLFDICDDAASFYHETLLNFLRSPNGRIAGYLKSRDINEDTVERFGLGYASGGHSLYNRLKKRYSLEDMVRTGLIRKGDDGSAYDFYKGRLMFPIKKEGRTAAFGGRVLDAGQPKYINSPDTEIFSKRKVLYGFPEEKSSDSIVICEGYMDLITMKTAGIENSAAVLGTALTKEHMEMLKGYKNIYLTFDSDEPGMNAAVRSIRNLRGAGFNLFVPDLAPYDDPDDFLKKAGKDAFAERLEKAGGADGFLARHTGDLGDIINILLKQVS